MSQTHAMASRPADGMDADLKPVYASLAASLAAARPIEAPYRHWLPADILPEALARDLAALLVGGASVWARPWAWAAPPTPCNS